MFLISGCSYSEVFNNDESNDNNNNNQSSSVNDNENIPDSTPVETETIEVAIGQNIQYDNHYNIAFNETLFTQEVEPTSPGSYYTYFPAGDGNVYLVLKTVIKNLGTNTLEGENLPTAKLIYDDKYNYDATLITESDDSSELEQYDWYMDIDPLKTKKIWYIVEVPVEVQSNTDTSLVMQYKIDGKTYEVKIR